MCLRFKACQGTGVDGCVCKWQQCEEQTGTEEMSKKWGLGAFCVTDGGMPSLQKWDGESDKGREERNWRWLKVLVSGSVWLLGQLCVTYTVNIVLKVFKLKAFLKCSNAQDMMLVFPLFTMQNGALGCTWIAHTSLSVCLSEKSC